ncbi:acyl carrier protein [Bacteroides sp. AM07-18]|jgi:acyl carrier protein|uniref:Acyl carrier protein n=1 Tax=Bacteroides uniformis TaxID=820 RepID=A0A414JTW1_BACUN|nr:MULTISPECIES: acyl carrier protein [Bacteroides]RGD54884.1 acyl carrier protein [Bacteroides sp. AM07-18]RHE62097.1 acyl carrier protein [Bacteroides uniformis]RJU30096.1 acyl carrier protein [Bacteroides sp. AM51-7]RJU79448.1 acyl carrier protein [Bacteroides sp. AM26-2]
MTNLEKYNEIFVDVFAVEQAEFNDSFSRENVKNWDSIHQLNLISYIEDEFDIMFDAEDSLSLISYNRGIEILSNKYGIKF